MTTPSLLVGYSLGGRLAMHSALADHACWKGVVLISSHPGLVQEEEREKRRALDEKWALLFEKENWETLINKWNSQEVLAKSPAFPRQEAYFDRKALAALLRNFSLGAQKCLTRQLEALNLPILWIVGGRDKKYVELTESLSFSHPLSKKIIVRDAGHRVPWEASRCFMKELDLFRRTL